MTLLERMHKDYFDTWLYAFTDNHTEKSYIRFVEIKDEVVRNKKKKSILVFAYYMKTNRINYYKINDINQLNYIDIIEDMDKDTEEKLNALFAKELLTQRL